MTDVMPSFGRYLDAELVGRLDRIRPSARRNVDGLGPGSHRSPLKGASLNFRQHRAYVRGDDPRRLDWRVLARTDRLFVREFDHDSNLQCALAIDTSGSMAYQSDTGPTKSAYANTLATALAYLLLRGGESVGLATLDADAHIWLAPAQGSTQLSRIVDRIERSPVAGAVDLAFSLGQLGGRLDRRCLVILFSDLFTGPGPLGRSLARLTGAGHQVICLQILHPDEINFPFRSYTRLHSLETAEARYTEPAVARTSYLSNLRRHTENLRRVCAAGRSMLLAAQTDQSPITIVDRLLRNSSSFPQ